MRRGRAAGAIAAAVAKVAILAILAIGAVAACGPARDDSPRILLGTTHTLEDSGILDSLSVAFRAAHPDAKLHIVVAGSGEIMTIARRGDLDVILTHSPRDEQAFIAAGRGVARRPVMHNTFVLAGPVADPARVASAEDVRAAFLRIRDARAPFISRGDESGTHRREREIWEAAGVQPDWDGYEESGSGMADVLRVASQRDAYTLTDVATLVAIAGSVDLVELFGTDDPLLINEYSVIVVTDAANAAGAALFADWITSPDAQGVIARFGNAQHGRPLFHADAR